MTIPKGPQVFPRSEYLRRLAAVKSEMAQRNLDALVVKNVSNIMYLTGHAAKSGYVAEGLVVSMNQEEPTFILRAQDAPAALHTTFLARDNVIGYPESLVGNDSSDGFDAVIDFLHELGVANSGVGLEFDDLQPRTIEKFKARLPKADILDCSKAVTWIRLVKSDLEIALLKESAGISDAAIMRAAEVIRPGVSEAEAAAEIVATLVRGANGKPGTSMWRSIYLCSSPRTGTPHIPWSEDVFRHGTQVNLEVGGVRHGYVAPIMRTFSIGQPSARLRRVHEAEAAGLEAALETVRPGVTCSDVAQAFNRAIEKHGLKKESRCGYPVGIDWLEPTASLKEGDLTELKPNMTFHLMLGNWIDEDFGYVLSETFRVTESGVEVLTKAPRKLFEL